MGHSVTSKGQESGSAFSVQNTDKEVYIEYLPLVAKGYKKLEGERSTVQLLLDHMPYLYPIQHTMYMHQRIILIYSLQY